MKEKRKCVAMHLLKAGPLNKYDCLRQFSFSTNEAAYLICFSFIQLLFLLAVRNFIGNIEMLKKTREKNVL